MIDALQSGRDQRADAAGEQRERWRRARQREPQPLEHDLAHRRLHGERDQADGGVVDREKPQQAFAASERRRPPAL